MAYQIPLLFIKHRKINWSDLYDDAWQAGLVEL